MSSAAETPPATVDIELVRQYVKDVLDEYKSKHPLQEEIHALGFEVQALGTRMMGLIATLTESLSQINDRQAEMSVTLTRIARAFEQDAHRGE